MKRPAFQFYPADWRKDAALQSCSIAARGLWLEAMCIAHECEPYGHLTVNGKPMTPAQIARLVGISPKECGQLIAELDEAGVLSTTEDGAIFSRRMVRDEHARKTRGVIGKTHGAKGAEFGQLGAEHGQKGGRPRGKNPGKEPGQKPPLDDDPDSPDGGYKPGQKPPQNPRPSSSSSSSTSVREREKTNRLSPVPARPSAEQPPLPLVERPREIPRPGAAARGGGLPECPHRDILALWAEVLPTMPQHDPNQWRNGRADHLRARWRESAVEHGWTDQAQGIEFFRRLFHHVGRSRFLTGREQTTGRRPFFVELEWLVTPGNWAKTIEGKYHEVAA